MRNLRIPQVFTLIPVDPLFHVPQITQGLNINKKGYLMKEITFLWWALTDSNRRPSACKADALNQLS